MDKSEINRYGLITEIIAKGCDLEFNLVRAIITVESSWDPRAKRYESGFYERYVNPPEGSHYPMTDHRLLATSIGLQIMGLVAREQGYQSRLEELFIPEVNILYGCIYLRKLSQRYQKVEEVIAAYNAGSARITPQGFFVNQGYVDKVVKIYKLTGKEV